MSRARLIHNPKAGDGTLSQKQLLQLLDENGYTVTYANAKKKKWDHWEEEDDLVIIAGGDGTVRKVVKQLIQRKLIDKRFPLAVLPLGTANNIASTFYSDKTAAAVMRYWQDRHMRSIDVARVRGLAKENFFIEGLGIGVFPALMKAAEQQKQKSVDAKSELRSAQQLFEEISKRYKPHFCKLIIDGRDYSGDYVLVEVMNMQAVGPKLQLARHADPSDGLLEVVLVPAQEQEKLAEYARLKHLGQTTDYTFQTIPGKDIRMQWDAPLLHVDDRLIHTKGKTPVHIQVEPGLLLFYTDGSTAG